MNKNTLTKIEFVIEKLNSVDRKEKTELLKLLHALKLEISALSKVNEQQAEKIAHGIQEASIQSLEKSPSQTTAIESLSSSMQEFESSHPKLVEIVNKICVLLSSIGI